jgi:hypothetical protein
MDHIFTYLLLKHSWICGGDVGNVFTRTLRVFERSFSALKPAFLYKFQKWLSTQRAQTHLQQILVIDARKIVMFAMASAINQRYNQSGTIQI